MTTQTVAEWFGNHHNPCLTRHNETGKLEIQSEFSVADYETIITKFFSLGEFCTAVGECSPDDELTENEWSEILAWMANN